MTDEVAELVLADNYDQNLALANAEAGAPSLLHVHEDWMRSLERAGVLDRELEGLPTRREVARRIDRKEGLSAPELSVLMSWTKIVLAEDLLDSDLPDDPFFRSELFSYFPAQDASGLPRADGAPPAAPRDRGHPDRQPAGRQRRHDLLPPAGGRDLGDHRRAGAGQLHRPRDLRRRAAGPADRLLRQPARRRRADPHAPGAAHARGARLAVAAQQPARARGRPSTSSRTSR